MTIAVPVKLSSMFEGLVVILAGSEQRGGGGQI